MKKGFISDILVVCFMLIILVALYPSCKAQPQQQPIEDIETGLFCELPDSNMYQFEAFYIEDFIYDTIHKQYVIEYADESVDDIGGYIQIECPKNDFFDVLRYYADDENYEWVNNYLIKEVFTAVEGGVNIRYYLVKKE